MLTMIQVLLAASLKRAVLSAITLDVGRPMSPHSTHQTSLATYNSD